MKNFRFGLLKNIVIAASLLLFFTQCNDDAEEIGGTADLVGVWDLQSTEVELKVAGVPLLQVLQTLGLTPEQAEELIEEIKDEFSDEELSIEFTEDNMYEVNSSGLKVEEGTWSLNGSTLSVDPVGDDPTNFEVLTLNATSLVVSFNETDDVEYTDDGKTVEVTADIEYTFAKQ